MLNYETLDELSVWFDGSLVHFSVFSDVENAVEKAIEFAMCLIDGIISGHYRR
jgi:hypothetical protein